GILIIEMLPIKFTEALHVAGKMDKLNIVNFEFDLSDRYNFWSGITAAVFLFLSYFGTDQSQVQRYLNGKSLRESRMGLIMNGFLKIPMQFVILFIGVMVFVFYQFYQPPIFFNEVQSHKLEQSEYQEDFDKLKESYSQGFEAKNKNILSLLEAVEVEDEARVNELKEEIALKSDQQEQIRDEVKDLMVKN